MVQYQIGIGLWGVIWTLIVEKKKKLKDWNVTYQNFCQIIFYAYFKTLSFRASPWLWLNEMVNYSNQLFSLVLKHIWMKVRG